MKQETVIFNVADVGTALYGRRKGEHDAADWQRRVPNATGPTPWIIDFAGVTATSSSYVDATLGEILTSCTSGKYPDVHPVVRNVTDDILDELLACFQLRSLVVWVQKGQAWRVAGPLDISLKDTLIHITTDEVHGTKKLLPKATITQAAWSNRLTALLRYRLIIRTRNGKTFQYSLPPRLIEPGCVLDSTNALFLRSAYGLSR